ncbi:MAG: histidine kinase, partial [Ferruginibacter sp.]
LYQLDKKTMQPLKAYPLPFETMTGLFQDSHGRYWVSTHKGMFIFNNTTGSFTAFKIPLAEADFLSISEWNDGTDSWLFLPGFSLLLINTKTLEIKSYAPNIYNKSGYEGTYWGKVFIDRDNRIWMGYERGCNILQMHLQKISIIPITTPGQIPFQEPEYKLVTSLFEDSTTYWVHKPGVGFFNYNREWKLLRFYSSLLPVSKTIVNKTSYCFDSKKIDGNIYVTGNFGLIKWNLTTNSTNLIKPPGKDDYFYLRNMISITPSELWIRTYDQGIYVFDINKSRFTNHFLNGIASDKYLPGNLTDLLKTKTGKIFILSETGLISYNNGRFLPVFRSNKYDGVISSMMNCVAEDNDGLLWVGTAQGIFTFDPVTMKRINFSPPNKMMGNIYHVLVDKNNNVWCNTRSAIWCMIRKTQQWISYSSLDGLPAEVYECVLTNLKDGAVTAGIGEKLIRFSPDFLTQNYASDLPVYITDALSGTKDISLAGKPLSEKNIFLQPGEKSLTVDFSVLNYDQPRGIKYFYKLEPSMKEFKENPDGHLTFNNLSPDKYRLSVRGGDKLNNRTNQEDGMTIIVQPYWYQTGLFKILLTAATVLLVVGFVWRRIIVIRKEASFKQKIAETEMQALRAQMNPHFIFNSLNSIENFMLKNEKRTASDYLGKFALLIRMILDSSRNELVPFTKDIQALHLYVELEQLRFDNKFIYKNSIDPLLMNGDYLVPPLLIQPFVENAIIHGLSQTDRENPELMLTIILENNYITYTIQDNGIGRKQSGNYTKQNKQLHKSMGVQITQERISIFNRQHNAQSSVTISDLYEKDGTSSGTSVRVTIKGI